MQERFTHLRVKKTYLLVAVLLLSLLCDRGVAQQVYREAAVKSAIMFNLIKFVEWPASVFANADSPFIICIYGENQLQKEIVKWDGKEYYGHPIEVVSVTDILLLKSYIADIHMLYVAEEERGESGEILPLVDSLSVLTVSDYGNFFKQGGIIALTESDGKTRFSLNLDSAMRSQLKVSAKLAQLSHALIKDGREIEGGKDGF